MKIVREKKKTNPVNKRLLLRKHWKSQPSTFLSSKALNNLTSPQRETKNPDHSNKDHSFSSYANFFKKLALLMP